MSELELNAPAPAGHVPVLVEEVIHALAPVNGAVMVDGTYGGGGYARAALSVADITLLAIDRDPEAMERAWAHAGKDTRLVPAAGRFGELDVIVHAAGKGDKVDGVMLDLGVSSFQLDEADRGFSFMRDGPLDMRMEKKGPSAADAVNHLTEGELADIFHILGEEPGARRVARGIVFRRKTQKFETTMELADCIERSLGGRRGKPTHPATRSFQALRMWVNDESGELVRALAAAERVLKPGGPLHIADFGPPQDRIMELISWGIRWFEEIYDHVLGRIPLYIAHAGFQSLEMSSSHRTIMSTITLYHARKL
mgnify:CR=1 FL=1